VTLQFSNHGGTIPKEKLERIFEQFYRLDTGRGTGGAGLGLAIAKQIITLHNGTITVESRDGLTVFTVILPAL
ncbi:ATP-binding protein, partial [Oscillibacter sp. CU971]|uniref:ATP-binding protein n=1 Tax=Oscillibacter sp. CU971 TaxID=2780102 RepID=UPI001FAFC4E5